MCQFFRPQLIRSNGKNWGFRCAPHEPAEEAPSSFALFQLDSIFDSELAERPELPTHLYHGIWAGDAISFFWSINATN